MTVSGAVRCGTRREQENQVPAERFLYYGGLLHIRGAIVRMNIHIDERLLSEAMRASGCKTKRATVAEGLRLLARVKGYRAIFERRETVHWDGDPGALRGEKARVGLKVARAG